IEVVDAPDVAVVDATGAGDVFAAAFVWAGSEGRSLRDALSYACLYASLSVRAPTAFAGALAHDDFMAEARSRGLG
ncbi:MAG: PfkB family carbohydrate kinase, partial [Actinomycetota bacterium]